MKVKTTMLVALLMIVSVVQADEAEQWEWVVAPYIWASDVELDASISGGGGIGGKVEFRDLLDKIDVGFMGRFEGRRGRWGLYLDTIYADISDSNSRPVGPGGPILGNLSSASSLNMQLWEAGGLYQLSAPEAAVRIDVLAGLRYIDMDMAVKVTLPGPAMTELDISSDTSETDLMLGGRAYGEFAQHWHWTMRGDYSFGGTEGVYNGAVAVGRTIGETGRFSVDFGYRYMRIDMKGTNRLGERTESETEMSGPLLGFAFTF